MAKEDFVPVACDDWYHRRRKDAEGEFWRKVSDGAEHGPNAADGVWTRQGFYMLTAVGTILARKYAGQYEQGSDLPHVIAKQTANGGRFQYRFMGMKSSSP